jgi:hypothetical protein
MKAAQRLLIVASIAALAALVPAQTASAGEPSYSKKQVKEMMRDAHTPEQYRVLGAWFHSQEKMFDEKAAAEKKDWEQRVGGYRQDLDPAHNRYHYYVGKAQEMGERAADYAQRSR